MTSRALDDMLGEDPRILCETGARLRLNAGLSDAATQAQRLLGLAALHDFLPAQVELGIMHRDAAAGARDRVRALMWFYVAASEDKRAVNQAQTLAASLSARDIKEALSLSQDFPRARTLFQSALDGDVLAMTTLAQRYAGNIGCLQRDAVLAAGWFMRALRHDQGNAAAQFGLGLAFFAGDGVEANLAEARRLLELAAVSGHPQAQYTLADWLERDAQDQADLDNAIRLYREAAGQGHALSQYRIGLFFKASEGVNLAVLEDDALEGSATPTASGQGARIKPNLAPHMVEALRYFRQAAEQGHAQAQLELGQMLAQGLGAAQNMEQAAHWYLQAAEQGEAQAGFNLGFLYAHGQGVKQDFSIACAWYALSEQRGYAPAKKNLEIILKKMTPAEIERADWQREVFFNRLGRTS